MNKKNLIEAESEAKRFLRRLAEYDACDKHFAGDPCPDRAAVRRASMDLSRALAKLRKP